MGLGSTVDVTDSLTGSLAVLVAIGLVFVLALIFYVLYSMGTYGIALRQGYDKPWIAWIPIVNVIMVAILVEDEDDVRSVFKGYFVWVYAGVTVIDALFSSYVPILSLFSLGLTFYAMYYIFRRYSENVGLNMVLLILTGGAWMSIQLFRYRNREPLSAEKPLVAENLNT